MAINTKIATDIAFKRLAGNKSYTNPTFTAGVEKIGSNIQASSDILFGEKIPTSPGNTAAATPFDTASGGVIQLVTFDLIAIGDSQYDADASGIGSNTSNAFDQDDPGDAIITTHSFALHFPSNYESQAGSNSDGNSQNPKAGTGFFKNNLALTGSGGSVQIVPPLYGSDYAPTIKNEGGVGLTSADAQDFYLDTFAGVLVRQDGDNGTNVPKTIDAYVYIGKMVSESLVAEPSTLQSVTDNGNQTTNNVNISGSLSVTSSLVDFSGATSVTASLVTASAVLVHNNVDIDGGLDVASNTTIGGTLDVEGNTTIGGNLTVQGTTTTVNTANVLVEDRFLLLASSSEANLDVVNGDGLDGGIIVARHNLNNGGVDALAGTALFYDHSREAWSIAAATGSNVDNLIHSNEDGSSPELGTTQVNIATIEINASGAPKSAGGDQVRPRPFVGGDNSSNDGQFAVGQMYVDLTDNTNGGLYIYLPE
jgi:hypothetical protein